MKTSITNFRRYAAKAVMALALATVVGGAAAAPALADSGDWRHGRSERQDNGRQDNERRDNEWRDYGWRAQERYEQPARERGWGGYEAREHRTYGYEAPGYVYAAPPTYSFVFPLNIR